MMDNINKIEKLREYAIKNSVIFEQEYHPDPYSEFELTAKLTKLDNNKIYNVYDIVDKDKNEIINKQYDKNIDIANLKFVFTYGDYSYHKFERYVRRDTRFPNIPIKNVFLDKLKFSNVINIDLICAFAIINNERFEDTDTYKFIKLEQAFKKFTKYRYFKKDENQRLRMIKELSNVFINSDYFFQFVFKDLSVLRSFGNVESLIETVLIEIELEENKNINPTKRRRI